MTAETDALIRSSARAFGFLRDSVSLWLNGFLHGTRGIQAEAAV